MQILNGIISEMITREARQRVCLVNNLRISFSKRFFSRRGRAVRCHAFTRALLLNQKIH